MDLISTKIRILQEVDMKSVAVTTNTLSQRLDIPLDIVNHVCNELNLIGGVALSRGLDDMAIGKTSQTKRVLDSLLALNSK